MNFDILVPIFFLLCVLSMVALALFFQHRTRKLELEAIRAAVEKTGIKDPALIKAITQQRQHTFADLRKGILFLCAALGLIILGQTISDQPLFGPFLGLAAFPGLIGLAYLLFHFIAPDKQA